MLLGGAVLAMVGGGSPGAAEDAAMRDDLQVAAAPTAGATPPAEPSPPSLGAAANGGEIGTGADTDDAARELRHEVARLRRIVNALEGEATTGAALRLPEGTTLVLAGLALAVGWLIGSAWERRRGRRERSLRF